MYTNKNKLWFWRYLFKKGFNANLQLCCGSWLFVCDRNLFDAVNGAWIAVCWFIFVSWRLLLKTVVADATLKSFHSRVARDKHYYLVLWRGHCFWRQIVEQDVEKKLWKSIRSFIRGRRHLLFRCQNFLAWQYIYQKQWSRPSLSFVCEIWKRFGIPYE